MPLNATVFGKGAKKVSKVLKKIVNKKSKCPREKKSY